MAWHGGLCNWSVCCGTLFEEAAVGLGHVARRGERAVDGRLGQGRFHTLSSRIILLVPGAQLSPRCFLVPHNQGCVDGGKDGASVCSEYLGVLNIACVDVSL